MTILEIILGVFILLMSVVLITAVLLQSDKDKKLSGAITGGSSDTFFGKSKAKTNDKLLNKITTILSIVFVVLVVFVYILVATNTNYAG